jgi:hypothetical protein
VELRQDAVEHAIGQQAYGLAKELVGEGIRIAKDQNHAGTVRKWEEQLLKIAYLEQDQDAIRRLTRQFAFGERVDTGFYRQWKATFTAEEWPAVIAQHVQEVIAAETARTRQDGWNRLDLSLFRRLSPVYVEEAEWDKLLHLLPEEPGEQILHAVHAHLAPRYPVEMLRLYLALLEKAAAQANGRNTYQEMAVLMIKVKRDVAGSHAAIDRLAEKLIQAYPRRRAMAEELRAVLKAK